MNFEGSYRLPVPQQHAWDALNDPGVLKAAIAGCERFEAVGPGAWLAVVRASVGPIGVTFRARLTVSDAQAPHRYTLTGEGQGGAAGHARLRAQIELEPGPDADSTLLRYSAQAEVGGKIASLGSRLMQSIVRQHTDAFFESLAAQLQPGHRPGEASDQPTREPDGPRRGDSTPRVETLSPPQQPLPRAAEPPLPPAASESRPRPAWTGSEPAAHPLAAPAPAWLVVFGTTVGVVLGYCLGLLFG
jgi:carbon monoxide dehydrogenase subunit G